MPILLKISAAIDKMNERIGWICNLLILFACIVSAANAMIRYAFDSSSNGWLEAQWYMFAFVVMFGSAYTLRRNEHVRVEIFYVMISERNQLWLDLFGFIVFLIPCCVLIGYLSWPFFYQSYWTGEVSSNAGGLLRWPIKAVIPVGFAFLVLQGLSEIIKRIAALRGQLVIDTTYERPTQ